jgi:group II intron reverse transcriptase/maturase
MVRHSLNASELWESQDWKKFHQDLFRLQRRVFKAVQVGDKRKARSLQKLILKSQAARFLAIQQVTQLNTGKKTAGIDGQKSLTFEERFELEKKLADNHADWKHKGLREIPIPKKDGTIRMLKVPTIADRAWQCLAKYALEPAHEATFHARSYGFRTGRATHDAQKILFLNLSSKANGKDKRVIELDIEKCFDRINHSAIMDNLIAPSRLKLGIFRCLKAGTNIGFPDQGTPQGGVVSPLLANIALNGIESIYQYKDNNGRIKEPSIRYADDMVIIIRPQDDAKAILERISEFLAARGMNVSEKKTKLTATTDGFDFLGWHFKVQKNGKFRSIPSVDNYKAFRKKIKTIVNNSNYGATVKASKLAPVVRGWRQYHKHCKMDGSRNSLYYIESRAYTVFNKETKQNRYTSKKLLDIAFPKVPYSENKHINVKGEKSPYDGDIAYWSKRNSTLYDGATSKALKRQNHSCNSCGLKFVREQRVHLHHVDGNHQNWRETNLVAIHQSCHQFIHMSKSKS